MIRTTTSVALVFAVVGQLALERSAHACSQVAKPQDGVVETVVPFGGRDSVTIPKDGAIALDIRAGAMSDDALRSKVKVVVTSNAQPIAGKLAPTAVPPIAYASLWLWKPDAELPTGPLEIQITIEGQTTPQSHAGLVTNDLFALPKGTIAVEAKREVRADENAPQIRCPDVMTGGGCGPAKELSASTHWVALPLVAFRTDTLTDTAASNRDVLVVRNVRLFGRSASGVETDARDQWFPRSPSSGSALLDHADDEYCAQLTITSLVDPQKSDTTETCIPHGSLDLTMSADDEAARVRASIASCKSPVFPPGYSASAPAGTPGATPSSSQRNASDEGGCAIGVAGTSLPAPLGLAAIAALALVRRKRSAR